MWDIVVNEVRYTPRVGDCVLDIGAHHGYFALYCAMRGASVVAYEPDPDSFKELEHKAAIAKELGGAKIIPQQFAVWSEAGERRLWRDQNNSGANSMVRPVSDSSVTVKTVPLSVARGIRVWDFVKVDVEGAEAQIFLSAKRSDFRSIRYLTMELHNHVLTAEQHAALVLRMKQEFYRVEEVSEYSDGLPTGRLAKLLCWGSR